MEKLCDQATQSDKVLQPQGRAMQSIFMDLEIHDI